MYVLITNTITQYDHSWIDTKHGWTGLYMLAIHV